MTTNDEPKPEVTRHGLLNLQVCVPESYTDEQATDFANSDTPCGTTHGWQMIHTGDDHLAGDSERVKCEGRAGCVHIMFLA